MICRATGPALQEFYENTYRPLRHVGCSDGTIGNYQPALTHWRRFAGDLPLERIDSRLIARFQEYLLSGRSPASINTYVRPLMAILRLAADEEIALIDRPPKVRKLKEPKHVPLALTVEEFGKVLATATTNAKPVCGIRGTDWWAALLLVCWETGLRYTALLSILTVDVLSDSGGLFCQAEEQKSKEGQWFPLPPDVLRVIETIYLPDREFLFPHDVTAETIGKRFRRILDRSGIYAPKGSGMRFHRLRRSKASYTKALGGDATLALGHSTPSVTERYFDPRITRTAATMPPMPSPRF